MRHPIRPGLLPALLFLVLPPFSPARAADHPLKEFRHDLVRLLIHQKSYDGKAMDRDLREAYATYVKPWSDRG